ncbi:MAG: YggS family pyridoxal phosphate-dependent enzyme [Bacteroidia bacterium]|nr:YggS family pyridoxal phosphate-dependent enzyme [Bacteroidia bacterium]NNF31024.1 YggS family pyridoxal phosphate-dependent enzyme [Flavobacteriaceae bacterium]MBT8276874.1 YggS family pyridoxal phosphate-dependent enzyme [Bacteroidia bacterium]NNJ82443.1 YggS family pyridoxal phosphate-dependent enzyme [Flavobacteriaceae bacterium]NNK53092.1 YggS family pyridoxal phosphate-dependent enzyme [Flavobacteriaceae bacterium]
MSISENIKEFKTGLPDGITLVAVTKTKPVSEIMEAYETGQRVFGENKIQEMEAKWRKMPEDVEWHMIGHVQRNKVKYMAEFVSVVHAVDSLKLLKEINKQAAKHQRVIHCMLQLKIASEETKFGMHEEDAKALLNSEELKALENIKVVGLMGMATFTDDEEQIRGEFQRLKNLYDSLKERYNFSELSMGMSGDYKIAIAEGSTMIRVGSAIFGARNYG